MRTAVPIDLVDAEWEQTSAGRLFNYKYGYGKLNAGLFVDAVREWTPVKPQAWLVMPIATVGDAQIDGVGTGAETRAEEIPERWRIRARYEVALGESWRLTTSSARCQQPSYG